jgi:tRNA(Ile2) C34 agmatinyltransferase TiaS
MIYVGIDDTDTLDDPGTNQLARHLVRELATQYRGRMIVRHQLLEDPRVPCTKKNGCASILFEPVSASAATPRDLSYPLGGEGSGEGATATLINALRDIINPWCPKGSDPGFCVTSEVPPTVIQWGLRCKKELMTQAEARKIAADAGIHLEGLGGTQDGVIGALAAIGLAATKNDGRVVYSGPGDEDWYDVTGMLSVDEIMSRGVNEVRTFIGGEIVTSGTVAVGKRLRPNYRCGHVVLYVTRADDSTWEAVRVT